MSYDYSICTRGVNDNTINNEPVKVSQLKALRQDVARAMPEQEIPIGTRIEEARDLNDGTASSRVRGERCVRACRATNSRPSRVLGRLYGPRSDRHLGRRASPVGKTSPDGLFRQRCFQLAAATAHPVCGRWWSLTRKIQTSALL